MVQVRGGGGAEVVPQPVHPRTGRFGAGVAVGGVADAFRNNFIAHGFIVVDANGNPMPRINLPKLAAPTNCVSGMAGNYPCHNIDYLAQVPLQEIPTAPTSGSEVWGIVDLDDNREYAIFGHRNGTAFYDVTNAASPRLVANIPGNPSLWREVKAYQVFDAALGRREPCECVAVPAHRPFDELTPSGHHRMPCRHLRSHTPLTRLQRRAVQSCSGASAGGSGYDRSWWRGATAAATVVVPYSPGGVPATRAGR